MKTSDIMKKSPPNFPKIANWPKELNNKNPDPSQAQCPQSSRKSPRVRKIRKALDTGKDL